METEDMLRDWGLILSKPNGLEVLMSNWAKLKKDLEEVEDANDSLAKKVFADIEEKKDLKETVEELKKEIRTKDDAIEKLDAEMKLLKIKISKLNAQEEIETLSCLENEPTHVVPDNGSLSVEATESEKECIVNEDQEKRFEVDEHLERQNILCFWNDQGFCKYGRSCSFKHPTENCKYSQWCQDIHCQKRHPKLCFHQNSCPYGNNCAFLHLHQPPQKRNATNLRSRFKRNTAFKPFGNDDFEKSFESIEEECTWEESDFDQEETDTEEDSCYSDED